jgi:hypothetical protein
MVKKFSQFFNIPWYPIAISAYPVLALLSSNAGQIHFDAGIRPLAASIAFGGLVFFILRLIFKQAHKAAFLSALWLGLFFSFGHAYIYIDAEYPKSNYTLWLEIGCGILFALALLWATRPKLTFITAAPTINTISAALIIMTVWQSASSMSPRHAHALGADNAPVENDLSAPENPPDVYYFLLDSYGRADVLNMAYHYDNSDFLNALKERGFYIGECSQSNYVRTDISMAATLNMTYLQDLDSAFTPDSTKRSTLWDSLKHSAVRYNFENMGYQTVNFATGFAWNELDDADVFIAPPPMSSGMTEFEGLFLDTTLARYVKEWGWVDPDAVMGQAFRDRFNNIFDSIDKVVNMPGAQFAYIHVISPHPPFVFDPNGNPTYPPDFWNEQRMYPYDLYTKGYVNQVQYLNKKVLSAIDTILAESKTPPIIIIQGDHGPWMQPPNRRMWILNAYYLPENNDKLYKTITPVNTFRLVFNTYFGGKYEMLKDVSYFSPVPKIYDFSVVFNQCK